MVKNEESIKVVRQKSHVPENLLKSKSNPGRRLSRPNQAETNLRLTRDMQNSRSTRPQTQNIGGKGVNKQIRNQDVGKDKRIDGNLNEVSKNSSTITPLMKAMLDKEKEDKNHL